MVKSMFLFLLTLSIVLTGFQNDVQKSDLLYYNDSEGVSKPVKTRSDWKKKRVQIIEGMEKAMGELPDRTALPDFDMQISETAKEDTYTRLTISFKATENDRVSAYLYIPFQKNPGKKLPAMLVLHGTARDIGKQVVDGHSPSPNRAHAKELAQRGYVVIAPDYPGMGAQKDYDFKNDRYQSGSMKAIFDDMRCIDLLQSREEVDPYRLGVIGHSLGGHGSLFVGAFDTRLKVIVSSSGWTLMHYYKGGKLGPWAQDVYMPLIRDKYNLDPEKVPFDFDEVIAALAPRAFFSNSPLNDSNFDVEGVRKGIAKASEVYGFFKAKDKLQVRYPDSGHDFPHEVRLQAYQFIDKVLKHTPNEQEIE